MYFLFYNYLYISILYIHEFIKFYQYINELSNNYCAFNSLHECTK